MATAAELAAARYASQQKLATAAADAAAEMWAQVSSADLFGSWQPFLRRLFVALSAAQFTAAARANDYVSQTLAAQGVDVAAAGQVSASAFAGVASDGRSLQPLLQSPVFAAKIAIAHGATVPRAMAVGQATLETIVRTQVGDAGRVADGVAIAARPRTGWVRMLVGSSCPRCVILAGRFYRYSSGFERHPNDDCISIPAVEDTAGDYTTDPRQAFDEGRVRGLSAADEQAIRDGADMAQVVNAHQGMSTAGGVKTTTTGTSRRGLAGQRLQGAARLMPEAIYQQARSRDEAIALLHSHGYIV